ncbi:hypothetical protein HNQ88_004991 [Aureibacter tunicatorum]|uniref:Uncharacterized protein n=1 Tax=Aureibacter tunicatorum TaxID=866807 RepID=A0AAE3XTY3_9BACT|nr:hypothetical protein [Aureibacter tunicatorum]BDD07453.1 hypothetical protein AUTU_49360 [Aureibacter tunicatorum]
MYNILDFMAIFCYFKNIFHEIKYNFTLNNNTKIIASCFQLTTTGKKELKRVETRN